MFLAPHHPSFVLGLIFVFCSWASRCCLFCFCCPCELVLPLFLGFLLVFAVVCFLFVFFSIFCSGFLSFVCLISVFQSWCMSRSRICSHFLCFCCVLFSYVLLRPLYSCILFYILDMFVFVLDVWVVDLHVLCTYVSSVLCLLHILFYMSVYCTSIFHFLVFCIF